MATKPEATPFHDISGLELQILLKWPHQLIEREVNYAASFMSFELNLEGEGLERLLRRAERASGRNASKTWWLLDWNFKSQYANIDIY